MQHVLVDVLLSLSVRLLMTAHVPILSKVLTAGLAIVLISSAPSLCLHFSFRGNPLTWGHLILEIFFEPTLALTWAISSGRWRREGVKKVVSVAIRAVGRLERN